MKKLMLFTFLFSISIPFYFLNAQELPQLKKEGNRTRLYVDGKPFIMVAGELHNYSSSSLSYLAPIFPKLKEMGLNTAIASVAWEQVKCGVSCVQKTGLLIPLNLTKTAFS